MSGSFHASDAIVAAASAVGFLSQLRHKHQKLLEDRLPSSDVETIIPSLLLVSFSMIYHDLPDPPREGGREGEKTNIQRREHTHTHTHTHTRTLRKKIPSSSFGGMCLCSGEQSLAWRNVQMLVVSQGVEAHAYKI